MSRTAVVVSFGALLALGGGAFGVASEDSGGVRLPLSLERGITIDRQLRSIPPEPRMRVCADDIRLIKNMGFEFVKLLVNPAVFKSEGGLKTSSMEYFDELVGLAVGESLPAVVCIHPEDDFKRRVLGSAQEFDQFDRFVGALSRHIASRWNVRQVALQVMTEPYGGSSNPGDWNYWNRLQTRLWRTIRGEMPGHVLILSGDMIGSIEGLFNLEPVDDERVVYCFTFYEPHLFTFQGGAWLPGVFPHVKHLPYPASNKILAELPRYLDPVPESLRAAAKVQIEQYATEGWDRKRLALRLDKAADWRRRWGGRTRLWCAEFGCYQGAVEEADRCRYLHDMRCELEEHGIGWAYWSYNETFSVMKAGRTPFGRARDQTPDTTVLQALLPEKHKAGSEPR